MRMYSSLAQLRSHIGEQHIFPDITFTCSGTVTKWIVGALKSSSSTDATLEHPQLQLWRENGSFYQRSDLANNTTTDFAPTEHPNVYEYIPSPPLEFSEGDILGVYQPGDSQAVLQYQWKAADQRSYTLQSESSVETFTFSGAVTVNYDLPFVGVEIDTRACPCVCV